MTEKKTSTARPRKMDPLATGAVREWKLVRVHIVKKGDTDEPGLGWEEQLGEVEMYRALEGNMVSAEAHGVVIRQAIGGSQVAELHIPWKRIYWFETIYDHVGGGRGSDGPQGGRRVAASTSPSPSEEA